jgi:hypothetical protein
MVMRYVEQVKIRMENEGRIKYGSTTKNARIA